MSFALVAIVSSANSRACNISDYDYSDIDYVDSIYSDTDYLDSVYYDTDYLDSLDIDSIAVKALPGQVFNVMDSSGADFEFVVNDDGESVTLKKGNANGVSTLIIPSYVEALDSYFLVTEIGNFAFITYSPEDSPMKGVTQLIISEGLLKSGQNAFQNAPDLEMVELPSSFEIISYCMFENCKKLKEVIIPYCSDINTIGSFAFAGCSSLESFMIPISVTKIDDGPWRDCASLQSLILEDGNYNFVVHDGVLYKGWRGDLLQYPAGKKDKNYQVLYGTQTIGNSAFYGNPYIESISLPASLMSISHIAFFNCDSLKNVIFNNPISFIGNKAFADCPKLKEITLYGTPNYTYESDDSYNTFSAGTHVNIKNEIPLVVLPKSQPSILNSAWDHVARMPYFYNEKMENNKDFGFPDYFGHGKAAVYGNAGPKPEVLHVLEAIPSDYLALENHDENDRTTRIYLDKSDKKNPLVLYFFGGRGSADLVVVLFEGGNLKKIEKMIDEAMQYKNEK